LDDGPLTELDAARFSKVMMPKAAGAWYLHEHTQNAGLDFFVLFSSISSLIGNARQGNYVAANAFLDALAHYRRAQGLPATSINWGVLAGVGMAAADEALEKHLQRMGMKAFAPDHAMEALGRVLEWNPVQLGVMDVDWQAWRRFDPAAAASPRFSELVAREAQQDEESGAGELRRTLQAMDPEAAKQKLATLLVEQVAATLRLPPDKVDLQQSLTHMGVDSLMAIELQTGIGGALGIEVSPLELMKAHSIAQLAVQLFAKWFPQESKPPVQPAIAVTSGCPSGVSQSADDSHRLAPSEGVPSEEARAILAELDQLTDDQVEQLLKSILLEKEC
jgi:acyl carrier protein